MRKQFFENTYVAQSCKEMTTWDQPSMGSQSIADAELP